MSLYMDTLRRHASDSWLDIYALGHDREKWESRLKIFARRVEHDTLKRVMDALERSEGEYVDLFKFIVKREFGVEP